MTGTNLHFSFPSPEFLRWRAQSEHLSPPDSHQVRSQRWWVPHPLAHIPSPRVHGSSGTRFELRDERCFYGMVFEAHKSIFFFPDPFVFFSILPRACGTSEHKGAGGAVNSKTA